MKKICSFLLVLFTFLFGAHTVFGQAPPLGASSTFALFTAVGAFNGDPGTSVVGDIGTNVGAFTPPGFLVGNIHVSDPVSAQAATDVAVAYGFLAALPCAQVLATPFGNNQTLTPKVYCIGSAAVLNANLTLDGGGNPGAIFIFQINGALTTNIGSNILLINGANLCNVYWQVNGAFNHNGTLFQGTVIAAGAINLGTGARLTGRGLSTMGAINTSANTVTLPPTCLCDLTVTCPNPNGGTFQCPSNIPVGVPANVTVNTSCGTPTTVITNTSTGAGCVASPYVLTRTYTVTDQGGHTKTCVVTYTAIDQTAPTITCPAGISVSCTNNVPVPAPTSLATSDNCGGVVTVIFVGDAISNQTCANRYTITRTYRASDFCGNSATCSQTITVNDITAPSITCPANVVVSCASNVPPAAPATVVATDLCGGTVTVVHVGDVTTPGACPNRFTVTRTYRATDLCGNSATCTQTITVNDITAPIITCPVNVVVSCASDVPAPAPASVTASDLCGGAVTVVFVGDVITAGICANRFSIARTYRATDICGNSATCVQTITVNDIIAPTFINPPANVTVECFLIPAIPPNPTASDNCTGPVTVIFLGEIQTPGICPILYTLVRTWRATDACGNSSTVSQTVTVQDTYAPQFNVPPVNVVLECNLLTNDDDYQEWLDNHGGAVIFDCSAVTWTWMFSPLFNMPSECGGTSQRLIRFIATDQCGNSAFWDARFTIVDTTPPNFTILPENISIECWTGETFDDQLENFLVDYEVSDDCGEVVVNVVLLNKIFGCGDTYTSVYQFRATDECGNTTFVTATFGVIDILPPVIDSCPQGNVLLTCEFDIPAPNPAGVVAHDNCGTVTVTVQDTFRYGVGCQYWPLTYAYTYAATDECGNVSLCYQSFQVVDSIPPTYTGPDTIYVLCVADLPGPGDLGDVLAPYFVDNCYNIICVGEHVDTIGSNSVTFCVYFKDLCVNWADKITVTFIATGGCKPLCTAPQEKWGDTGSTIKGMSTTEAIEQLTNKYGAVTAGDLGKTISVGSAACLQAFLPSHGHTNQFPHGNFAFDNANECQIISPVLNTDGTLKNKLAANVLALQLNIWFNLEFNDRNLGVQLLASLPPALIDQVVLSKLEADHFNVQGLLNLSNDYLAGVGFFPQNFGSPLNSALENVNSYWEDCQTNAPSTINANVAGYLKTEPQDGLEGSKVQLLASNNAGPLPGLLTHSNDVGFYEFPEAVPILGNYTVIPTSEGLAPLNGVNTYDLILISKHILGWEPFNSPYKMIAADANKSGSITTFDIVEFRKLILGIYAVLPNNSSWRFVDKSFVFPDLLNPFSTTFPESKALENIHVSQMKEDFVSLKVGDVNGSAQANALTPATERNQGTLLFDLNDRAVKSGEIFELKMRADKTVQGFQFTLNTNGLEVLEVSGKGMAAGNFAVFAEEAAMTSSWNLPEGNTDEIAEFSLKFRATQSGLLSKMLSLSSRITRTVAYGEQNTGSNDPIALDIALRFSDESGSTIRGNGFELYQNVPNPFVDKTLIGFQLPEATQATLTIYDQTGRVVYMAKGDFAKGYNAFTIDGQMINTIGTLLCKLETATDMATQKMIQAR
ncbi:MAG: DUF3494 domain-containing protein [Phycisphaerae bacterium]|nr:DUF3494 domain-containing protein [Saprospiraceae bacterium]